MEVNINHPKVPALVLAGFAFALSLACGGGGGGNTLPPSGGGNTNVAPAITGQPSGLTVTLGQAANFIAAASGNPAPAFQWERSSDGNNWTSIGGATSASYSFTPAKADHAAQFRTKATNVAGTATSNSAPLAVQWVPTFTLQPASQSVSSPAAATFTVLAEANPAATYQWQSSSNGASWADQAGATGAAFQTGPTLNSMNNLQFRCVASNAVGSATSNSATLLVNVPSVTLTVNLGTGTTGTPAATAAHAVGTSVNYAYSAQPGFTNLQVALDGNPVASAGTVNMDGAHTLAATASAIQRTVTFTAGAGGNITGTTSQVVPHGGSTAPVTAAPDAGFSFVNWTGNGFTATSANPLALSNVTQDYGITANFSAVAPTLHTLTVNLGTGATGTPAAGSPFTQGSVVPYSYTAQAGFNNLVVRLDGSPVAAAGTVTMDAAHTLAITAQAIPDPNTIKVGQGGLVFSPDSLTVQVGTTVTFHWSSSGHSMVIGNPCSPSGVLDSGIRSAGYELTYTPMAVGDVPFYCSPHCGFGMTGVIHVVP